MHVFKKGFKYFNQPEPVWYCGCAHSMATEILCWALAEMIRSGLSMQQAYWWQDLLPRTSLGPEAQWPQQYSQVQHIHSSEALSQTKHVRTILPVSSICYSYVSLNMSQYVFLPSDWTPIWNLCQGLRDGRTVPWNTNGKAQIRPNEFLQVIASCHGPNDGAKAAKAAKAAKRQQERLPKHGQVAKMRPSRRYPWGSSAC
jgi:hypothetical protein